MSIKEMRRVYKYQVLEYTSMGVGATWNPVVSVTLPYGADILRFDMQRGILNLWALVTPTDPNLVERKFRIAGTGHDITEEDLEYVSTFYDGGLVMHVFEWKGGW